MTNIDFNNINVKYLISVIIVFELLLNISIYLVNSNDYTFFYLIFIGLILFYVLYCLRKEFNNFIEEYISVRNFTLKMFLLMFLFFSIILAILFVLETYIWDNYVFIFNKFNLFNIFDELLYQLDFPINLINIQIPFDLTVISEILILVFESILLVLLFTGISLSKLNKIGKWHSFIITSGMIFIFPFNNCFLMFLIFLLTYIIYRKLNNLFTVFFMVFLLNWWSFIVDNFGLTYAIDPILIFVFASFSLIILVNIFSKESFWNET